MTTFLILIDSLSKYDKKDIDEGETPQDVYEICSIIRTSFCTSYGINKQNDLYIFIQNNNSIIKFEGNNLRYLGPDERSQALLLKKGMDKSQINEGFWIKSTPGISVKKFQENDDIIDFFISIKKLKIAFVCNFSWFTNEEISQVENNKISIVDLEQLNNISDYIFILTTKKDYFLTFTNKLARNHSLIIDNIIFARITMINNLPDTTLYINFLNDRKSEEFDPR